MSIKYHEIERVTICDEDHYFDLHKIDVEETMEKKGVESEILAKKSSNGFVRIYVQKEHQPDFDSGGMFIVATEDGEVTVNSEIESVGSSTRDGIPCRKYKVEV